MQFWVHIGGRNLSDFWPRFYIVVLEIASFSGWIYFFHILFGLFFPFPLWTLISLFSLDFSLRIYSIEVTFWISSKFLIKPQEFLIWLAELWNSSNIYLVNFHFLFQKDKRIIGLRSVKMKKLWDTDYKHILHIIKQQLT